MRSQKIGKAASEEKGDEMDEETPLLSEKRTEHGQLCRCVERPHLELWHGYKPGHVADIRILSAVLAIPVAVALRNGFEFLQNWKIGW